LLIGAGEVAVMTKRKNVKFIGGYDAGHPWYYLLGNPVLSLKQIRNKAIAGAYRGYMSDDIHLAARKAEPQRSIALRKFRLAILEQLANDISHYRKCVFNLRTYQDREGINPNPSICDDIHVAVSLKHNHIYNDFAHLACLDELPNQQGDLFG